MNILIQPASDEDVAFCAALEKECFSEPWSINSLAKAVTNSDTYFYVASLNNEPVGYFVAGNICDEINLYTIAVSKAARGRGVGKALIEYLKFRSIDDNAIMIGLEVRKSNITAIALYESVGFELTGKRPGFYNKPKEDALLYTLILKEEKQ